MPMFNNMQELIEIEVRVSTAILHSENWGHHDWRILCVGKVEQKALLWELTRTLLTMTSC